MTSLNTSRMTRPRRRVLLRAVPWPGKGGREAINKHTFRKVLQLVFANRVSQGFGPICESKMLYFFASFRENAFARTLRFPKFLQI